jgi:hypothetical protein
MGVPSKLDEHESTVQRPFQYSLRSMLILTTGVAVALSLLVAGPVWLAMLSAAFLALAIPMALTIFLVYGRGALRTFSIGALFPAGVMLFTFVPRFSYGLGLGVFSRGDAEERLAAIIFTIGGCLVSTAFGLLAVGLRKIVEARFPPQPDRAAARIEPPLEAEVLAGDPEDPFG